jgi:Na+/proline symporter
MASIFIAVIAWVNLTPEKLSQLPGDFTSLKIPWRLPEFSGTENAQFEFFGALVIVWILKGFFLNAGGPAQMYDFQRFLAAKNDRDAAKVGAAWSGFLVVRWAMAIGIALLALTGTVGVTDSEKVMPVVLRDFLPAGIKGIFIAGLLAAFMSTFSSTVNSGASFIVRDIWQPYFHRKTSERQAVRFSYLATIILVLLGITIGLQSDSIAEIWNWIMMALGGGVIIPNVLRWYWWRMNGWGYALGTLGGILFSFIALFSDNMPDFIIFPIVTSASLILCIIGSIITPPVERKILVSFYHSTRPFGFWKPIKAESLPEVSKSALKTENFPLTLLNVILGMVAISGFYLFPMYLVGHWYSQAMIWFSLGAAAVVALRFTWYKNLPKT